jgi:DNA polymerase-3 subunit delta'
VDDPDKKIVPVDLVRQARADIYVRPNEADRKIYLFPRGHNMELPSQNALLKVLEEPPEYGVFLLLTENAEKLLPTVRSRCMELPLLPLSEEILTAQLRSRFPQADEETIAAAIARSGGYLGQAKELLASGDEIQPHIQGFADAICGKQPLVLMQLLVPMEKWKRDSLLPALNDFLELVQGALACRSGLPAVSPLARQLSLSRTPAELMQAVTCLKKAIEYTQSNVSPAAVCGYLEWALR